MMQYKDQWSSYRLNGHTIESPDGEGGWYVVDDDCPYADDRSGFESRCDEAELEFGHFLSGVKPRGSRSD